MTGEVVAFWIVAPLAVLGGVLMVVSRKSVHSALWLALSMICLAVLYIMQGAAFLGVVQIVVYTGAVMMLFLFVLMLVGVDASDSLVETLRNQRLAAVLGAIGLGALLIAGVTRVIDLPVTGVDEVNLADGGNVQGLARLIFTQYIWAFEITAALLITAALGAMVLAHRERVVSRRSQREQSEDRTRSDHVPPLPAPGVYARHNAVDTPGLLPGGAASDLSVPGLLSGGVASERTEPPALPAGGEDE